MLSDRSVGPVSFLRRREGEVMATQCNFHRLQLIIFTNN